MEALVERHFAETRRFFQLPQSFKEEMLVDGNSRHAGTGASTLPPQSCHKLSLPAHVPRDSLQT